MKIKLILTFLLSSVIAFGQYDSYDVIIDSSSNYRIGDKLLYEANYYKAIFYYDQLNNIDSLTQRNSQIIEKIDTIGLYYTIPSNNGDYLLLFYIDKLDSTKFAKDEFGDYYYKDVNLIFSKDQRKGCYTYQVFCELDGSQNNWSSSKINGTYWQEENIEKVKREAVASLFGNQYYFQTFGIINKEDSKFWDRIKERYKINNCR